MKYILLLILVFTTTYSQNIKVEYNFALNKANPLSSTIKKYTLEQNESNSIFKFDNIKDKSQFKKNENAEIVYDKDTVVAYIIGDEVVEYFYKENYYKDFINNSQFYNFSIGHKSKTSFVKEQINLFDWEISTEKDTIILGYACNKATSKFRGRNYVAYFSNQLGNQGGPWKFDGLPGVILKVYSTDGYLSINPTKIEVDKTINNAIKNPFSEKKIISFEQIKDIILESDKTYVKKMKSKPNHPDKITISGPDSIEDFGLGQRIYE